MSRRRAPNEDRIRAVLYLNGLRRDEIDEAVQEVTARTLAKPPREPGALAQWQVVVAVNIALDRHRAAKRELDAIQRLAHLAPVTSAANEDVLLREVVARGLAELDPEMRAVVVLRFYEDLALEEIARALDLPLGTVKSRLHRGLRHLREALPHEEAFR